MNPPWMYLPPGSGLAFLEIQLQMMSGWETEASPGRGK